MNLPPATGIGIAGISTKEPRKPLQITKWGKPSELPPGTGVGFYMMSGREAQQPENIIKFFEQLKGRAAVDKERAETAHELKES